MYCRKKIHFHIDEKYIYLSKWFNENLKIDRDAALEHIASTYMSDMESETDLKNKWESVRKCNSNHFNVENIHQQNFRFKCDTTSKRIHSNLTNLSSDMRKFISYNNMRLINTDLKCSQPFFLTLLLSKDFYLDENCSKLNLKSIEEYNPKELKSTKQIQNGIKEIITDTITLVNSKPDEENDIKAYIDEVQKGTLYEYFISRLLDKTQKNYTRDDAKKFIYRAFFSHNSQKSFQTKKMCDLFRECFPNVYSIIEQLKRNDYKALPILMQSIESYIFIEKYQIEFQLNIQICHSIQFMIAF
jgi:hypothetical protein